MNQLMHPTCIFKDPGCTQPWMGAGGSGQAGTITSWSLARGQSPLCPGDTENILGTPVASPLGTPSGNGIGACKVLS